MVDDSNDKPAFVELYICRLKFLKHVVGDSLFLQMLYKESHFRVIAETAILLIETEMGWV